MTADAGTQRPEFFTGGAWFALVGLLSLTNFMEVLDLSIANVSLNNIAGALAVSPDEATWVVTSYSVANAIAIPLTGWLAKRFGQVSVFIAAIIGFTIASAACGLSTSLPMLLSARVIQGATAGMMIPLSQALMINLSPPRRRPMALAAWSMTVTVGPIAGPLLGGWITDNYHWSWIFFINVPAGIVAAIFCWNLLRQHESPRIAAPVDAIGLGLLVVWVGSLQILLDKGNELDWFDNPTIRLLGAIAAVGFCVFLAWELTERDPVVDLRLFKFRNFSVGIATLSLGYAAFFGTVVLLPLLFQTELNFTATWSGRITAPMGLFAVLLSPVAGALLLKVDPRLLASIGLSMFAICSLWRSGYTVNADVVTLALPQLAQGVGVAFFFAPIVSINTGGIPPERMPSASGFQNFARMMLGSFGTSMIVAFWDRRTALHRTHLVEALPDGATRLQDGLSGLGQAGIEPPLALGQINRLIDVHAHMLAANDLFWGSSLLFMTLVGLIWLARPPFGSGRGAH